jgi:hypothetical protein
MITGYLLGHPADLCQAGEGGPREHLTDVVQRHDELLDPVQGRVIPCVQEDRPVVLG